MKNKFLKIKLLFVLLLVATMTKAQLSTLTSQPDTASSYDCTVTSANPTGKYPNDARLPAERWTSGGIPYTWRGIIKFADLSGIPQYVIINSAKVYLYGTDNAHAGQNQSNAVYYQKVTSTWGKWSTHWNNQPTTTTTGQYALALTTNANQVDSTDITGFVQNWVDYPTTNYGMMVKLQSEANHYCMRVDATSDYTTNTAWRPKIVVKYAWRQFKTRASGAYNSSSTWSSSDDGGTTWVNASIAPNYAKAGLITIQSGHTVTLGTDTIDEVIVNSGGTLTYTGSTTLRVNNGTGTDLVINGTFIDEGSNAISWATSATWSISSTGTLVKTNATSCDAWRDSYEGGISAITPTANWIFRKTTSSVPTISTTSMTYCNLSLENNYASASMWTINYAGSGAHPTFLGSLNVGGSGTYNVTFNNQNTNATKLKFAGGLTIKSSSIFSLANNVGTEIQGDLSINGTLDFNASYTGPLVLSGWSNQTISAGSNQTWKTVTVNKGDASKTVTMNKSIAITGTLTLTKGLLVSSSTNLLTINNGGTVASASDSGYVSGVMKKIGNVSFKFDVGKGNGYHPVTISAPSVSTDAYTAEYFGTGQPDGSSHDGTFNYLSTCEYWDLSRTAGSSNVSATLTGNALSCLVNMVPSPRLAGWNGSTWKDLGLGGFSFNYLNYSANLTSLAPLTTYGHLTLANNTLSTSNPLDTLFFVAYPGDCEELYISEYVQDTTNSNRNKAIELFNPTGGSINLSDYYLTITKTNSTSIPPINYHLSGTIPSHEAFVIANSSADAAILSKADLVFDKFDFNGKDGIGLVFSTNYAKIIDKIGDYDIAYADSGWVVDVGSTKNHTLVRKHEIQVGNSDWNECKDEWYVFPRGEFNFLGNHQTLCALDNNPSVKFSKASATITETAGGSHDTVFVICTGIHANTIYVVLEDYWHGMPGSYSCTAPRADYSTDYTCNASVYGLGISFNSASNATPVKVPFLVYAVNDGVVESAEKACFDIRDDNSQYDNSGGFVYTLTINDNPAGIRNFFNNNSIEVYPNPFNEEFIIENKNQVLISDISITDVLGRDIMKINPDKTERITIDTRTFGKGLYFVKVSDKDDSFTVKLMKQ